MKRLLSAFICLIIICTSAISVSAANAVSGGTMEVIVASDGSCQVMLDLTLQLDGNDDDLIFPIPDSARNITVNGNAASSSRDGNVRNVKLSSVLGSVSGNFSLRIQYTLPNVVAFDEEGRLFLTLPMLSGFNHPIEALEFSIFPSLLLITTLFRISLNISSIALMLTAGLISLAVFKVKGGTAE